VPDAALIAHIHERLELAQLAAPADLLTSLASYIEVLGKWNARINLTAYSLERPSAEAIDRLIVEPVSMARFVGPHDRVTLDVGSGGGSPALPFRLAAPSLQAQMLVESRQRKAAFLREAVRQLGVKGVTVDSRRLEELGQDQPRARADIITMRAVRPDAALSEALHELLNPGGRFFWLTSESSRSSPPSGFTAVATEELMPAGSSTRLVIMTRFK